MDKRPLVTIGIPVYNGEKYLKETLSSLIDQTYKNIEIIVSDNCSTDNTVECVKEMMREDTRIKLNVNENNLGFAGNLNKIIDISQSEYIALYHADDIYEKNIVESQIDFLRTNKDLAGCFTLGKIIIDNKIDLESNNFIFNENNLKKELIVDLDFFIKNICETGNIFICPTAMIKKKVYQEIGGFNENIKYIEDQDMWIRILEKYNLGLINKELINYRIHKEQGSSYYSSYKRQELSLELKYLKKYLKKKRYLNKYVYNLNKRISNDYLMLARNAVYLNDYEKFKYWISMSKRYYNTTKPIKFMILQKTQTRLMFWLVKVYIKFKVKFLDLRN